MTEKPSRTPASAEILAAGSRAPRLDDRQTAQIEMRNAIQWLARAAQSYAAAPNGRLQLHFDEEARRLSTPDLGRETRLSLDLPSLVFQFYERGVATPHALDVDDRSSSEIEAWLLAELLHRGFDRSLFRKELPYVVESQLSGDETKYSPHRLSEHLERLTQKIVEAANRLGKERRAANDSAIGDASNDLLFWPDRGTIGFKLPRDEGVREIAYETDEDATQRVRVPE